MQLVKDKPQRKKTLLPVIGILMIILSAVILLWSGQANSNQAMNAVAAQIYFDGEYRIGDGAWQDIADGEHIPATKGDVTLRGNFHMNSPGGEYIGIYSGSAPIAFYSDHISLTFFESGLEPYIVDHENPLFGDSACGVDWTAHAFTSGSAEPLEILIHNPHRFGNETAIDDMLSNLAVWGNMYFETDVLDSGKPQRNTGLLFTLVSFVLLGIALFSTLIHIKHSRILWLFGLVILFAGTYFMFDAAGVSFWQEFIVTNTNVLGSSMMFYMLFLSMVVVFFLNSTKKAGTVIVSAVCVLDAVFLLLPVFTDLFFYDTWFYWAVVQMIVNILLIFCLIKEFISSEQKSKWGYIGMLLPLIAFDLDVVMTHFGLWRGGVASKYVFCILFVVTLVVVLRVIPNGINAAAKAKELETERNALNAQLAENRISTMISQIRPHFIYNTLGTIEFLCDEDPSKARKLVHSFAKYLRGNLRELDSPRPIRMSQEIEHVKHYISIETVRFPDITFTFDIKSDGFMLPALTIQPIVENAIKHGLMPLEHGGSIRIASWETPSHYCVSIEDDGVGFDPHILTDEKKHIGLRNIRERLEAIVDGTLEIESTAETGTKVVVRIPKSGQ